MRWLNEPREWSGDASDLTVAVEPETDFWRVTHYGFTRDNGHFARHRRARRCASAATSRTSTTRPA